MSTPPKLADRQFRLLQLIKRAKDIHAIATKLKELFAAIPVSAEFFDLPLGQSIPQPNEPLEILTTSQSSETSSTTTTSSKTTGIEKDRPSKVLDIDLVPEAPSTPPASSS